MKILRGRGGYSVSIHNTIQGFHKNCGYAATLKCARRLAKRELKAEPRALHAAIETVREYVFKRD